MDLLLLLIIVLVCLGGGGYYFYPGPWRNPDGSVNPGSPPAPWAPNNLIGLLVTVLVICLLVGLLRGHGLL
jgi:hypothetical protein